METDNLLKILRRPEELFTQNVGSFEAALHQIPLPDQTLAWIDFTKGMLSIEKPQSQHPIIATFALKYIME